MIQFKKEDEFRAWLVSEIQNSIRKQNLNIKVLESKNVSDIIISKESESLPVLAFIEVKLYKVSSGRIGIGQGGEGKKGKGFQPEILIKRPIYFDRYLRWVICNQDARCVFADNETVVKHAVGGEISEGKQNNIRASIFDKEQTFELSKITDEIINYLKTI